MPNKRNLIAFGPNCLFNIWTLKIEKSQVVAKLDELGIEEIKFNKISKNVGLWTHVFIWFHRNILNTFHNVSTKFFQRKRARRCDARIDFNNSDIFIHIFRILTSASLNIHVYLPF